MTVQDAAWRPMVRLAQPGDVAELVRLRRLMLQALGRDTSDTGWEAPARDAIATELAAGRLVAAVVQAPLTGVLAAGGIAQLQTRLGSPGHAAGLGAYVSSMSTDPRWRRRGCATLVFDALMAECLRHGVSVVDLHATAEGQPIYERYGFQLRRGNPELRWVAP